VEVVCAIFVDIGAKNLNVMFKKARPFCKKLYFKYILKNVLKYIFEIASFQIFVF